VSVCECVRGTAEHQAVRVACSCGSRWRGRVWAGAGRLAPEHAAACHADLTHRVAQGAEQPACRATHQHSAHSGRVPAPGPRRDTHPSHASRRTAHVSRQGWVDACGMGQTQTADGQDTHSACMPPSAVAQCTAHRALQSVVVQHTQQRRRQSSACGIGKAAASHMNRRPVRPHPMAWFTQACHCTCTCTCTCTHTYTDTHAIVVVA
jgi:hypothetical protein